MISRSRGTTVSGKTARASRSISPPEVAVRQVRQREHPTSAACASSRGLARRRVQRLLRPLALLLGEGGLVDEQVGARAASMHAERGAVSAAITTFRPGTRRAEHLRPA